MDCGANVGLWTRELLKVFPDAAVALVEPQSKLRAHLDVLCTRFPKCKVFQGGAGGKPEQKLFSYWPDQKGSTFMARADEAALQAGRQTHLAVDSIPNILSSLGLPKPDLVKMDIQGMELEALHGMGEMLSGIEAVILECNLFKFLPDQPQAEELVAFMARKNFFLYDICGSGRRPSDGALSHLDMVFANDSGFLRKDKGW